MHQLFKEMFEHPYWNLAISAVCTLIAWHLLLEELRSVFGLIAVIVSAAAGVISAIGGILKIVDWFENRKKAKSKP